MECFLRGATVPWLTGPAVLKMRISQSVARKCLLNSILGNKALGKVYKVRWITANNISFDQMPPTSSQQQTQSHTQNHSTHSGNARGSSNARVVRSPWYQRQEQPNYTPQPVIPHYDPRPLTQDGFRNTTPMQFGRGDDTYWGNSAHGFNYDTTGTFGIGAPPPWNGGEYPPPQFQYGHFGQGGTNHTGFPFVAEPSSSLATNPSHPFLGTSAAQNNRGASPAWNLSDCWVAYEVQDELHLTIVFRRVPFS
ncbi:hypothetical protein EDB87DRAFT_713249 [Lactarius vividus]|nr:hypothetical protein EDB87DRAFT_713249 [Lactarius vividus]